MFLSSETSFKWIPLWSLIVKTALWAFITENLLLWASQHCLVVLFFKELLWIGMVGLWQSIANAQSRARQEVEYCHSPFSSPFYLTSGYNVEVKFCLLWFIALLSLLCRVGCRTCEQKCLFSSNLFLYQLFSTVCFAARPYS